MPNLSYNPVGKWNWDIRCLDLFPSGGSCVSKGLHICNINSVNSCVLSLSLTFSSSFCWSGKSRCPIWIVLLLANHNTLPTITIVSQYSNSAIKQQTAGIKDAFISLWYQFHRMTWTEMKQCIGQCPESLSQTWTAICPCVIITMLKGQQA